MTDAQYAEIIRHLNRIEANQKRLVRSIKIHDMKADGLEEANFPWLRLKPIRAKQITRVRDELVARCVNANGDKVATLTGAALTDACNAAFKPSEKGYPNAKALRDACCRVHVMDFV